VYKAHINLFDRTIYKSKLDMRYKMKNKFIMESIKPRIPAFGIQNINKHLPSNMNSDYHITFDTEFRYKKEYISTLNCISYLKLELRFDPTKLLSRNYLYSNFLMQCIDDNNDMMVDYILCLINNDKLISYYDYLYSAVLNSELKNKNNIISRFQCIYDEYKLSAKRKYAEIFGDYDSGMQTDELPPIIFLDDDFY
jgi:hypothetical protein